MVAAIETPWFGPVPPYDRHAITIHLPTWAATVRMAERDQTLFQQFKSFYPRLMLKADIKNLIAKIVEKADIEGMTCHPYPTLDTAQQCVAFATTMTPGLKKKDVAPCTDDEISIRHFKVKDFDMWCVFFPAPSKVPVLMPFWMHGGMGISSRFAEDVLEQIDSLQEVPISAGEEKASFKKSSGMSHGLLRKRIAELLNRAPAGPRREKEVGSEDVFLFQSGMSSIYSLHRYLLAELGTKTVLFGLAFIATPHVFEDFGPGLHFLRHGHASDLEELKDILETKAKGGRQIQALWTEVPANPLLTTPDLAMLRKLADQYGFLLIVDDTIGSFCNVDVLAVADVVVTSLTKTFSGYANLMAASVALNPNSKRYGELKALVAKHYQNLLYDADADALLKNSADYMERSKVLNNNAEKVVEFLDGQVKDPRSSVTAVYYPTTGDTLSNYKEYMRQPTADFTPGYGCLFSVEFKTEAATAAFYDNLHVHMGPHLGAHLTLAIPFVKAIYADEVDQVVEFGLNARQIRVSVGLEDTEALIEVFKHALGFANGVKPTEESVAMGFADAVKPIEESATVTVA